MLPPIEFARALRIGSLVSLEAVQFGGVSQEVSTALTPGVPKKSHLVLDEVHSFVLRLHLNPAHGGGGNPRPRFKLEHVNQGTSLRMQSLDEVFEVLRARIELILHGSDSGLI